MSKFIPYESPSAYFARKFQFVNRLRSLYFELNKFDSELGYATGDPRDTAQDDLSIPFSYLWGGLNPLLGMKKDLIDTLKPYKSNFYVFKDLLQLVSGIGNTIKGVFNCVFSPLIFLVNIFRYAYIAIREKSFRLFTYNLALSSIKLGGGLLDGLSSLIRGASQIVTTPLTWLIKMPLRGLITVINGKLTLSKNVENKVTDLEALVKKAEKTTDDTLAIDCGIQSLIAKLTKAQQRGQIVDVDVTSIESEFNQNQWPLTGKRLIIPHARTAQIAYALSYYKYFPADSENAKKSSLKILGLFKAHRMAPAEVTAILGVTDGLGMTSRNKQQEPQIQLSNTENDWVPPLSPYNEVMFM